MEPKFKFIKIDSKAFFVITFFISLTVITNWIDDLERYMWGVKPGVVMAGEDFGKLLPGEARLAVEELAIRYQKLPVEPGLDKKSGEIIPEKSGCIVDVETSMRKIITADENEDLELVLIKIYPRYSRKDLKNASAIVGYYETGISGNYQRFTNITLASSGINNTVVWPEEMFSFNEIVGPRTVERGYLPAPVILMGERNLDYGGGVCQVSSTLYNAAKKAGLNIIERNQHSKRVFYVPEGQDATVNYGYLDFRFVNNFDGPVIIKSGVTGGKVWVEILGEGKNS